MGAATPAGSSLRRRVGCCHQADDADAADPTAFGFREVPLSLLERLQDGAPALPGPPIRLSMGVFPPATDLYTGDMALAQAASRIDVVVATNRRAGVRGLTFGAGRVRSIPEAMPRPVGELRPGGADVLPPVHERRVVMRPEVVPILHHEEALRGGGDLTD
jgi:hypothetical protein